jgi:hypothetical protein
LPQRHRCGRTDAVGIDAIRHRQQTAAAIRQPREKDSMKGITARRTLAFAGIALPLVLGGCEWLKPAPHPTSPPPGLAPSVCTSGTCTLNVTVSGDCQSPADITVDKPLVIANAAVNMRWVISPPTFAFASNGIQIDPSDAQFEVKPSPGPNEFRIMNHHRSNGDFYYYINIQGCAQADPFIRNN